ncbi:MAG: hypothetical protein ACI8RD_000172 [Bacillariaceae sp.]|jgi:hypothetical protein
MKFSKYKIPNNAQFYVDYFLLILLARYCCLFHVTKNDFLRLSIMDIDLASINDFTFSGTAESIDPAPEQT